MANPERFDADSDHPFYIDSDPDPNVVRKTFLPIFFSFTLDLKFKNSKVDHFVHIWIWILILGQNFGYHKIIWIRIRTVLIPFDFVRLSP